LVKRRFIERQDDRIPAEHGEACELCRGVLQFDAADDFVSRDFGKREPTDLPRVGERMLRHDRVSQLEQFLEDVGIDEGRRDGLSSLIVPEFDWSPCSFPGDLDAGTEEPIHPARKVVLVATASKCDGVRQYRGARTGRRAFAAAIMAANVAYAVKQKSNVRVSSSTVRVGGIHFYLRYRFVYNICGSLIAP
jgi:hypothetical protein